MSMLNALNYFNIRFNLTFPKYQITPVWQDRITRVKESPDNSRIDHIKEAGQIFKDHQLMHNGLKISLGSYYDYGNTILLKENRGVHEPQEEYVFQEVLKDLSSGSIMLELGSYWAFYSMWFVTKVKEAKCFMVEPDPYKMNFGKLNFKLNQLQGKFINGFVSSELQINKAIPVLTVDHILKQNQLEFVDVLHSDIQSYEFEMLQGAHQSLRQDRIGYLFISTHSNVLHERCINKIKEYNFEILCQANLDQSYSWDGLIVAKSKVYKGLNLISISHYEKDTANPRNTAKKLLD